MKKLTTYKEFLNETSDTTMVNTLKIRDNGEEQWMYMDKDIKIAERLIKKLSKKYHVSCFLDTGIFKGDLLPFPVPIKINNSTPIYRTSPSVSFYIMNGKVYFERAFGRIGTKDANDIVTYVDRSSVKNYLEPSGMVGYSSFASTFRSNKIKGPYGEITFTGARLNNINDISNICDIVFGSHSESNRAEGEYFRNRGPVSGVGNPN